MTKQFPAGSPVDAVAAALLRDVAFALRMARRISNEIRAERHGVAVAANRTAQLTASDSSTTLVA